MDNLPRIKGVYTPDFPLASLTTIRVGGAAKTWAEFLDINDLSSFLKHKNEDVDFMILGAGSNVVIRDGGVAGVTTSLNFLAEVTVEGETITAGAGATCGKVGRVAREVGLSGLEFYAGIPGSIGGALKMNAGCYGCETADRLVHVQVMTEAGEVKTLTPAEVGYGYRHSALPPDWVFLGATYRLVPGEKEHIRTEMRRINAERRQSQPLKMPSSGSWFKNPIVEGEKLSAWRVVEAAGCRGKRVGQAQVSEQHCNFFVNRGGATSHELEELSRQVEAAILETQGIRMEREVRFIGVP